MEPIVREHDGAAWADSRDVAAGFRKLHKDVLKAYRNLACSEEFRRRNFAPFYIKDLTGESLSHVRMTKNGFAFLALGFTGAEAAAFKEAYITRFDAMEAELRGRPAVDPVAALNDPTQLRNLLLGYSERMIALEAKVEADKPKAAFYDRFVNADGNYGLQNAARVLGQPPNKFVQHLKGDGYLFYQGGSLVPKVQYRKYFDVKCTMVDDKARYQTFITPLGMQYFARKFGVDRLPLCDEQAQRVHFAGEEAH
nr:phage regulatory protein/antirepressor Ant [Roseomonas acroporae]